MTQTGPRSEKEGRGRSRPRGRVPRPTRPTRLGLQGKRGVSLACGCHRRSPRPHRPHLCARDLCPPPEWEHGGSLRKAHPLLQGAASLEPCWEPLSEGHPEPWDKPGNDNLKERYFREGEGLPVGTQTVGPPACSWEGGQAGGALAGASAPSG